MTNVKMIIGARYTYKNFMYRKGVVYPVSDQLGDELTGLRVGDVPRFVQATKADLAELATEEVPNDKPQRKKPGPKPKAKKAKAEKQPTVKTQTTKEPEGSKNEGKQDGAGTSTPNSGDEGGSVSV